MNRILVKMNTSLLGLALLASQAMAEPRQLTASEISDLISDRTVEGTWNETPYIQRFGSDGWTLYEAEGAPPDQGKWRVNPQTNQYESWWERGGWSTYTIIEDEGALFWLGSNGKPQPFQVRPES
jgi:hypothetical protein